MRHILKTLYGCVSRTNIQFQAERALPTVSAEERVTLERIIAAESLDEMHALIAEALGDPETAQALRNVCTSPLVTKQSSPAVGEHWPEQGGVYAGIAPAEDGYPEGHLVLLDAQPGHRLTWDEATAWAVASGDGARLPTCVECKLLELVCKPHLRADWYWTNQAHEHDASYAWFCSFLSGYQYFSHKSDEGLVVAVRRIAL